QVGLEEERPVAEPEGGVPLHDYLLLLDTDRRVEALGQPLGAPQVTAESPVNDTEGAHIPGALAEDAAGEDGGLEEQGHLTAVQQGRRLHAPRHADAAQDWFARGAEEDQDLIE